MMDYMEVIERIMTNTGWFEKSLDRLAKYGDLVEVNATRKLTGSEWNKEVQTKKDEVLENRMKSIYLDHKVSSNNFTTNKDGTIIYNKVRIIDKSYLEHDFKASTDEDQHLIDATTKAFDLNEEQE